MPSSQRYLQKTTNGFHVLIESALTGYDSISEIREHIAQQAKTQGLHATDIGAIGMTISEILTNLLKHPTEKAQRIHLEIKTSGDYILIDIADDSTPFTSFDQKYHEARDKKAVHDSLREGGYGLYCVLKMHSDVSYIPKEKSSDHMNHFHAKRKKFKAKTLEDRTGNLHNIKVFIVDDDRFALEMTKTALENYFNVYAFNSAEKAYAAFNTEAPDIIISDFYMPGMNGEEFRKALSKSDIGNLTPFVFLSGGDEKKLSYLSQLGIDDFLKKPADPEKLRLLIQRLVLRSRQIKQNHAGAFEKKISNILRPQLPHDYGPWSIALRNHMHTAGGGDFVLYSFSDHAMNILLSDVMGHGLEAKFFSYAFAGYLRSLYRMKSYESSPAQILNGLSKGTIDDELLESTVMTCLALRINNNGRVHIASAGHPPPLHLRKNALEKISVQGPLPGLSLNAHYHETTVTLTPGESIIFGTDGFLDHNPILFNPELTQHPDAEPIADHLWQNVEGADDRTLIVLTYGGTR